MPRPDGIPSETLLLRWKLAPRGARAASPLWGRDEDVCYRIRASGTLGGMLWVALQGDKVLGTGPAASVAAWACSRHALMELVGVAIASPDKDERRRGTRLLTRMARLSNRVLPPSGGLLGQIERTRKIQGEHRPRRLNGSLLPLDAPGLALAAGAGNGGAG
jgi:hypothetical protein